MREMKIKEYIFTEKYIKDNLGLEGDITEFELFEGLSPNEENENKSKDNIKWVITTREVTDDSNFK